MQTIKEAEEMAESELQTLVNGIVDRKLDIFKGEIQLQLLPIKIAVESHERQMDELRKGNHALLQGLGRIEGSNRSYREEQRRNHQDNSTKLDAALQRLDSHLGEHTGHEKHQSDTEKQTDRRNDNRRGWAKTALGVVSFGGILKWIHDHWHRLHLK
jgi:hypothetical protein